MFIDKEPYYGWYEQCIICGYTYELPDRVELEPGLPVFGWPIYQIILE